MEHHPQKKTDIHLEVDRPWTLKEDSWHGHTKVKDVNQRPQDEHRPGLKYEHGLRHTDIHFTDPRDPAPDPVTHPHRAVYHKKLTGDSAHHSISASATSRLFAG